MFQYSIFSRMIISLIILSRVSATARHLLFHDDVVDLQCHVCNQSYYCTDGVKFHCPLNSLSHSTLANDISDCVCIDGYVMPNTTGLQIGDRCDLGLPPFYYKDGLKFHCLDNKATIFDGASKVKDCVCVPGYAGLVGQAECNICLNGKYTFQANSSICLQCPLNSFHVLLGATSVKSCQCNAGYTGTIEYSDSICTACPAGKFKDNAGNSTCQECPQNTYSEIAASLCIQCPANSSSAANSNSISDCLCDPGFKYSSLNGGSCEMCLEGTYKNSYANTVCLACEEGKFSSERGSIVCNDCNNNSQSFPLQGGEICKCNAGYIQNTTDLILPVCKPCKANQYQHLSGQTTCVDCPENSLSPIATESAMGCLCNDGYFQQDSLLPECQACAAGTYKEAAFSPDNDYLPCSTCPINSHSIHTSGSLTECICNAGYEGPDGGPCTACVPGKFKSLNGSAACQSCDMHYFSDVPASTICTSCVTFLNSDGAITEQIGSGTSEDCICDLSQGFLQISDEFGNRTCSGCQAGTYATSNGCQNCTGGQYADVAGLTACKDCPANSSSYDYPHVACQCHAGYICAPDGENQTESCPSGNCIACPTNTFKDYTGGATACDACQPNSLSAPASVSQDDCKCDLGHRQDGPDTCVACLAGYYADTLNLVTCIACADRSYTKQSDFPWTSDAECTQCEVCSTPDHYDAANNGAGCGLGEAEDCQPCPVDTSVFQPSTEQNLNSGVQSCVCDANLYGSAGGPCNACPANSVRNLSASNSSISDCVCDAGFEPDPDLANECRACPVNTYKTGPGDYGCTACPDTLVTEFEGNTNIDACVCQSGYFYANPACEICGANTYKPGYNRDQSCTDCRNHSMSEAGSVISTDCKCILGFEVYLDAAIVDANRLLRVGGNNYNAEADAQPWKNGNPLVACPFVQTFYLSETGQSKSCNQIPSPYVISHPGNPSMWAYAQFKFELPVGTSNWLTPSSRQITLTGWFSGNKELEGAAAGEYIYNQYLISHPDLQCASCVPGKFKNLILNEFCTDCAINTFTSEYEQHSCASCVVGKSTVGLLGQSYCECDYGTERESSNVLSDCQHCAEGKFKTAPSYDEPSCQNCSRCAANEQVDTVCNRFQDITCKACQDNSWSYAGRTELGPCFCDAGYELVGSECVACPIGKARLTNMNNSIMCAACADGKFADLIATATCEACSPYCDEVSPSVRFYDGQVGAFPEFFNRARMCGSNEDAACATDRAFTATWNAAQGAHLAVDGHITGQGYAEIQSQQASILCTHTKHWWRVDLGSEKQMNQVTIYGPKTGQHMATYARNDMNEGITIRVGNNADFNQNEICASDVRNLFALNVGIGVVPCNAIGRYVTIISEKHIRNGDGNLALCEVLVQEATMPIEQFVTGECEITKDTVCSACTVCAPGQYAIQSCGIPFNNDRNDTKCALCPAGSYCPGGVEGAGIDVQPKLCPDEALSEVGSDDISDCICNPGWYRTFDQCEICPYDMFCPGTDQAIPCPYPGKTFHVGSTVRLDCHCPRSYYRNPPNDLLSFNCSLCTPNDYCFNNSLFNCTDPLMISDAGSGYFKNCTCIDRFYNDGEVCTQCSVDHYCVDGKEYECPENEWTNYLPRQAECVCQQGYYRHEGVCIMCPENFYCDGTDDLSRLCPQFSIAENYTSDISQCLCTKGYGAIYSTNLSEPHTCVRCIDQETFKKSVQNSACEACDICDPILHNTYTNVQCTAETDTSCDACSVCHDPLDPNPRTKYALEVCNVNFDTVCANCTVCDYTQQWHDPAYPCTEQYDRECLPINFERVCPVGEYAGNHTIDKDSECLPCQYHDIYYQGARLHEASTRGLIYNDPFSCEITCLQPSRLRNISNILQGCKTCETGNVLFKHFTGQSDFECIFDCLPGYEKVMNSDGLDGDCILGALNTNPTHYFNHSINISHVERVKNQNNVGAFRFTVSHTSHGRFVVLVGQQAPTCTGRERSTKHLTLLDCCMNNLWRVSTKMQMGLDTNDVESCTRLPSLWSQKNSANQLQFEIADTEIYNVALCKNDTVGTDCTVTISILDTLTYQVTSVAAKTSMQRGSTFASIGNHHVYIPLSSFKVEMQLAYIDTTSHRPVLVIMSDMAPYEYAGTVNVAVHGTGLTPISPDENVNCERLQPQQQEYHTHLNNWTLPSNSSRFITTIYMQIPYTTDSQVQVKLIFTLHLVDRGSVVKNIMHIAVWRTVSLTDAICTQAPSPQTINTGLVLGCSGIGSDVVAQSNSATTTTHAVRGEIGSLTSFVAKNLLSDGLGVTMVNILLASALPPATNLLTPQIVNMTNGNLDFTTSFKQACFASQACHIQAVYQNLHHWGMFTFSNCNETVKQFAKNWLLSSYGVVNDQGHIDALCNLAHPTTEDKHKFLIALINTRAYLPQDHQWHDLQNRTANFATSVIHALFRFT